LEIGGLKPKYKIVHNTWVSMASVQKQNVMFTSKTLKQ